MITEDSGENFFKKQSQKSQGSKVKKSEVHSMADREPLNEQSMMQSDMYFRKVTSNSRKN